MSRTLQAEGDFGEAGDGVFEESFVDVADLFDIEGTVGEEQGAAGLFEELQGVEEQEDGAVVDGQGCGRGVVPRGVCRTPFKEGEAVGIEERAAQCRHTQGFVGDTAIEGAEESEQACPGVVTAVEEFSAMAVGLCGELAAQG